MDQLLLRADEIRPALRAGALRLRGGALHVMGSFETCDVPYEQSLAIYRDLGDVRGIASLLQRLGNSAFQRGELERARDRLEASQELAGGRWPYIEIANHTLLARIQILTGDVEGGTDLLRRSLAMAADVRFDFWRAGQLSHLAFLALDRGDVTEAEQDSYESLRLVRQDEGRWGTFTPLTALARVALARGEHRRAGLLFGAVEGEAARGLNRQWQHLRIQRAGPLVEHTDPAFLVAVEEGRRLELWDAVAIALGEDEDEDEPQTVP